MPNKKYIRFFLILFVITTLSLSLSGCIVFIPPLSPVVEIEISNDNWSYKIYVDGKYEGTTNDSGKLTLYNIDEGYHHFEAEDTSSIRRFGEKWQTIINGFNKVEIYTY
jgi:hypothetical protein